MSYIPFRRGFSTIYILSQYTRNPQYDRIYFLQSFPVPLSVSASSLSIPLIFYHFSWDKFLLKTIYVAKCGPRPWPLSLIWYFTFPGRVSDSQVIAFGSKAPYGYPTLLVAPPQLPHAIHLYEYLTHHIPILPNF